MEPLIYRLLCVVSLVLNLSISGYYRKLARAEETIPRSAESLPIKLGRVAGALPLLVVLLTYVFAPAWVAWASIPLPDWARWWLGGSVALSTGPLVLWVLRSLATNVSETVFTKQHHTLVTHGRISGCATRCTASGFCSSEVSVFWRGTG